MSQTPEPGSNLDASVFDLDKWIDEVDRPELVVTLYPYEATFEARVTQIEQQLERADRTKPEDRGINDASPEQLLALMDEVIAEREAKALRVTVRQPTDVEIAEAIYRAERAVVTNPKTGKPVIDRKTQRPKKHDPADYYLWGVAAACVKVVQPNGETLPGFTGEQLLRLRRRDRSGEGMVIQLHAACEQLMGGLPVPSSPAR